MIDKHFDEFVAVPAMCRVVRNFPDSNPEYTHTVPHNFYEYRLPSTILVVVSYFPQMRTGE